MSQPFLFAPGAWRPRGLIECYYDPGVVLPPGAGVPDSGAGAGVLELSGIVGAGVGSVGAGVAGAGVEVEGSEPGAAVSSFLSQAVSATASTEARIKVLLIIFRLL